MSDCACNQLYDAFVLRRATVLALELRTHPGLRPPRRRRVGSGLDDGFPGRGAQGGEMKRRVLFVCIHNSGRSQIGEGWLKHLAGDRFEVASAGIEAGQLNPLVVRSMAEAGVDIASHHSKTVQSLVDAGGRFDVVITVCDQTNAERCPRVPGRGLSEAERLHWGFPDPSALFGTDEEKLAAIRPIRDAIKAKIEDWLQTL